jgi:hypothetical protein
MQVGSSTSPSAQLQILENAAQGKYQDNQDFNALLQMMSGNASAAPNTPSGGMPAGANTSGAKSETSGGQTTGELQIRGLVAVGTRSPDGQVTPYSTQKLQSEKAQLTEEGATAYADALQNFMTLSQANGQVATVASMNDRSQFTTSLGSGVVYDSFALTPAQAGMG